MRARVFVLIAISALLALSPSGVWAQLLGSEFQVNTYTSSGQYYPAVAMDANGNFVIAWTSDWQDGSGWGVFAQQFDSSGTPVGDEFQVNLYTTNDQYEPAAATDPDGNFVIAWTSSGQDGSEDGVFARKSRYVPGLQFADFELQAAQATKRTGRLYLHGWFRPNAGGDGINLTSQDVTVELFNAYGFSFSDTIPAGSIARQGRTSIYNFAGGAPGEISAAKFTRWTGNRWLFTIWTRGVDCSDWSLPVSLFLMVGDDYGQDIR